MPVLLHQQPVLTLALDSFQDTTIDENDIRRYKYIGIQYSFFFLFLFYIIIFKAIIKE